MINLRVNRSDFEWVLDNRKHIQCLLDVSYMNQPKDTLLGFAERLFSERDVQITFDENFVLRNFDLD